MGAENEAMLARSEGAQAFRQSQMVLVAYLEARS
jgi:hypothetical protein